MGKKSIKENKNRYHLAREEMELTREEAADLLKVITADRIEKIENERIEPQPYDVLVMSQGYKKPSLCNYYCSHECPIGKEYVPEVQIKELSAIVIEMLASLNSVNKTKERLIDIAADGVIGVLVKGGNDTIFACGHQHGSSADPLSGLSLKGFLRLYIGKKDSNRLQLEMEHFL